MSIILHLIILKLILKVPVNNKNTKNHLIIGDTNINILVNTRRPSRSNQNSRSLQ